MQVPPETRRCLPWEGHEVVEIGRLFPTGWGRNQAAHLHPVGKGSGAVIHQIHGCFVQVSSFPLLHLFLSQEEGAFLSQEVFFFFHLFLLVVVELLYNIVVVFCHTLT